MPGFLGSYDRFIERYIRAPGEEQSKNLQYLKSAALSHIIDLEMKRSKEKKQTIRRAMNEEIYYIVSELRKDPFLEIKLPEFVHDLIAG